MNRTLLFPFLASIVLAAPIFADDAMTPAQTPTDAEIAQILLISNAGEVEVGKLAKRKTGNSDVKEFAEMMITEHSSVRDRTKALTKKLDLKPRESRASKDDAKDHERTEKKLKGLRGAEFDREYANAMVAGHQSVLDTIDTVLIPNAKSAELKEFLTGIRPAVETHLQHAKSLQAKLAVGKDAG